MKKVLVAAALFVSNLAVGGEFSVEHRIEAEVQARMALSRCLNGEVSACNCSSLQQEVTFVKRQLNSLDKSAKAPYRKCYIEAYIAYADDLGADKAGRERAITACKEARAGEVEAIRLKNSDVVGSLNQKLVAIKNVSEQLNSCPQDL